MIRQWLTIVKAPGFICSDRRSQFVGSWFKSMCKHMGIQHAKTVVNLSQSNSGAKVPGRQVFGRFCQLQIQEQGTNWFHSLWRI